MVLWKLCKVQQYYVKLLPDRELFLTENLDYITFKINCVSTAVQQVPAGRGLHSPDEIGPGDANI